MRISDWSSDVCSSDLRGKMMRILWTGAAALALAVSGAMHAAAQELRGEVAKQMPSLMAIYKDLHAHPELSCMEARKRVGQGHSVSVRVDPGGRRTLKKKTDAEILKKEHENK